MSLPPAVIRALVTAEHGYPFRRPGPPPRPNAPLTVRAFLRGAREVSVVPRDAEFEARALEPIDPAGLWEGVIVARWPVAYRLRVNGGVEIEDPYRFPSALTDYDLH